MQPTQVKRKARFQNPALRMSANNARDVVKEFLSKGLVQPVRVRRKAYLRFELTEVGKQLQDLMVKAGTPLAMPGNQVNNTHEDEP